MTEVKSKIWSKVILIVIIFFIFYIGVNFIKPMLVGYDMEYIRTKMKEHLHEKYGKEFVVDRIGTRTFDGTEFYQARIYPKSITGTKKEGDSYYYADIKIDKLSFGRLREPGDTYSKVRIRKKTEKYLIPKVKDIFGRLVKIKPEIKYYTRNDYDAMVRYITPDFKKALRKSIKNPKDNRLELDLNVYIFDRIENEKEKEKRRKDIFKFIQYLKEEGLFEYLEMRVVFVDERVLAYSYDVFEEDVRLADKVEKEIKEEDTTVKLPPKELRKEMSETLQREVEMMNEEELLKSMQEIRKGELSYDGIGQWNGQYLSRIYSPKMIKERYTSTYNQNPDIINHFERIDDVGLAPILDYIYE